jgi:hypothetical protein
VYFIKNAIIVAISIPIIFIFSVLIHEYGHVLGAKIVGADNLNVYVWPGYELTPKFGEAYNGKWPKGAIGFGVFLPKNNPNISFNIDIFSELSSTPSLNIQSLKPKYTPITRTQHGVIALMGSALNLIISFISALLIYKFKPKGIWFVITACGSFLFYDILFYTVFPIFLSLPHLIFWGGNVAEPIIALSNLGIDQNISITLIILLSILQSLFLYKLFFSNAKLINNSRLTEIVV